MKKIVLGSLLFTTVIAGNCAIAASNTTDWHSWGGAYAGADAGYGWGSDKTSFDPLPNATTFINLAPTTLNPHPDGIIIGPHAGYNWQKDRFVYGAEADFSLTDISGSTTTSPIIQNNGTAFAAGSFLTASQRTDWLSTARGRIGYTVCPRVLVYATGGLAFGEEHYRAITSFTPTGTNVYTQDANKTKLGWTAGAGAEYALGEKWSLKAEYLYYDLGNESFTVNSTPAAPPFQMHYKFESGTSIAHIGLSYKFN